MIDEKLPADETVTTDDAKVPATVEADELAEGDLDTVSGGRQLA